MTKDQEATILLRAAAELGADSYCGPWLVGIIPQLRQLMAGDIRPDHSPLAAYKEQWAIIEDARQRAAQIIAEANSNADRITEQAHARSREHIDRVQHALNAASQALDRY
jgi:cell division septum initiation protein DivIVA